VAINSKERILQSSELNDSERCSILGGNASRLFRAIPSFVKNGFERKVNAT